jgi:lysophospholipase L1-like esterase
MNPEFSSRIKSTAALCLFIAFSAVADQGTPLKFDFGPGKVAPGYTQILPTNSYSQEIGFGFEPGTTVSGIDRGGTDALRVDFCTSDQPFYFSVAVPEGNYRVTVTFGDLKGGSTNTVKAELRRLMIENVETAPGEFTQQTFTVNVRTPKIPGGSEVKLKDRERTSEIRAWDEKLTLEFNGARPCICALEIQRADSVPTVFLLGDSTVCDQPNEPWNSWGQMLPRFFNPQVAIANHAESGETLKTAIGAKRLDKVLSAIRPGDYLFIQFGHNDMKDKATNALAVYKSNLERFVAGAREKGALPVLVTSMERKGGISHDTLAGYPDTVREVAKEKDVLLIDLHALSRTLYQALGPDVGKAFQDGTHHNNFGSYELAKCVVQAVQNAQLPLAQNIARDFKEFDPSRPDPVDTFAIPFSPGAGGPRPLGD